LNKSDDVKTNDRKMIGRKMAFGVMPRKMTPTAWSMAT
jgi:hypothetical protein